MNSKNNLKNSQKSHNSKTVQSRNTQGRSSHSSAAGAFLITFFVVVIVGLLGIALIKSGFSVSVGEMASEKQKDSNSGIKKLGPLSWEEAEREEQETDGAALGNAEENDQAMSGYGPDGTMRSDGGRILAKKIETTGDTVTLVFAGDVMFDDSYSIMTVLRQKGGNIEDCFSDDCLAEMRGADIFMLNNECTFTSRGTPTEGKTYTFRGKPENAAYLKDMGADIVSIANNHTYDYGEISLLDTVDTLAQNDIPFVGAGRNLNEASEPVFFETSQGKIAFISASQIERLSNPDTKGAKENSPGVFRCFEETEIYDVVKKAKEEADVVVAYIHWGTESTDELDFRQTQQAQKLAEAGADLIIGDHPHVLQEISLVDGVPVIYSLGNYWFNSFACDTCLVKVEITNGKVQKFQFIPARQENCATRLLQGNEKEAVLEYMRTISTNVGIDTNGYLLL